MTNACHHDDFLIGPRDLNSGPQACIACTFPIGVSANPEPFYFKDYVDHVVYPNAKCLGGGSNVSGELGHCIAVS